MKPLAFSRKFLLLILLLLFCASAQGQQRVDGVNGRTSLHEQDAVDLLKTLAREIKTESDKLAAAALQSRIADVLWTFDEAFAREVFGWAFEAARKAPSDEIAKADRATYATRQAASIREVLTRLGARDQKRADALFKALEEDKTVDRSSEMGQFRSELMVQIALQLATTNPEQAQHLGLLSLSGGRIPEDFGSLLFALSNVSRRQSDELFRAALATLRRNEFTYDTALISLVNYLFSTSGTLHSDATAADAQLLANYFVDAAWRQARGSGVSSLPESSASFYSFVEVRGLPIVARYAPERVPELQGQMRELASRLSSSQFENTARMRASQQQQIAVSNKNGYDIDEQIDRATKEKDTQVRDSLLNRIAHSLMRADSEKALKIAAMIEDEEIRAQAEDNINLVRVQQLLASRSYEEARKTTSKFRNAALQARVLVELASKVLSENKDTGRATELLSEAVDVTAKRDPVADKLLAFLVIAQQFARFDSVRGFEALENAIKTLNQLKAEEAQSRSALSKPHLLTIKSYTVINGREMSPSERPTFDSIDFSEVGPLALSDYMQIRLLANKIEHPLRRAKFLTAVATAILLKEAENFANGSNR